MVRKIVKKNNVIFHHLTFLRKVSARGIDDVAHDASHHHANADPGFDRKFIDVDQRNEIKELLEAFDKESWAYDCDRSCGDFKRERIL